MAADEQVAKVLRAIEILDGRVRAATQDEISFLVPLGAVELEHALCRAIVGGWVDKVTVRSGGERPGVRTGDCVYLLTDMAGHRCVAERDLQLTA